MNNRTDSADKWITAEEAIDIIGGGIRPHILIEACRQGNHPVQNEKVVYKDGEKVILPARIKLSTANFLKASMYYWNED